MKKEYIDTNVGTICAIRLGVGFSTKGEIVNWFKVNDYFIALNDKNHYIESSDIDPRDDYDFIRI